LLKIWNLESQFSSVSLTNPLNSLDIGSPISSCTLHKETDVLCLATDQFELQIFDMEQQREVRRFNKQNQIIQIIFSPNGRWILAATKNKDIYVIDVLTNKIIDWFLFSQCPTSFSFSSDGALLATTHENKLGVNICLNKMFLRTVFLEKDFSKPFFMEVNTRDSIIDEKNNSKFMFLPITIEKIQLNQNLISLSSLPKITKRNINNWNILLRSNNFNVKSQNPIPFFFSNVGINSKFMSDMISLRKRKFSQFRTVSNLTRLIQEDSDAKVLKHLTSLTPIKGHTELQAIGLNLEHEVDELNSMLEFFERQFLKKENFDILQAYLYLFLKIHQNKISRHDVLLLTSKTLVEQVQLLWKNLEALFHNNLCTINNILGLQ